MRYHVDTDFLVYALSVPGVERRRLRALAESDAEIFRRLGSPRKRAADVAIGVTAAVNEAVLVTRNARDFAGIPGLRVEAVGSTAR